MEFIRFGSTIPGSYWGCCAIDLAQNFKVDPDAKASIQLVTGDGGGPMTKDGESLYMGPTYRDIFWQRLRYSTHSPTRKFPNRGVVCSITENQIQGQYGRQWMEILFEAGFMFVATVANGVYTGANRAPYSKSRGSSLNHIFLLPRNIGANGCGDSFTPPQAWQDLHAKAKTKKREPWQFLSAEDRLAIAKVRHKNDVSVWDKMPQPPVLKESEMEKLAPLTLAGLRSPNRQELKSAREARNGVKTPQPSPFAAAAPAPTPQTG